MNTAIDKELVHKRNSENVLVTKLRRILPHSIENNAFLTLKAQLDTDASDALDYAYQACTEETIFGNGDHYLMREVQGCLTLSPQIYEQVLQTLPETDKSIFHESYQLLDLARGYRLVKTLDDDLLRRIVRLGNLRAYYLSNEAQTTVSELLEASFDWEKPDVFFANMVINSSHSFFFEHPNEHVPGLMVIEAARQMVVSISHQYGKIGLNGSHLVLNDLDAKFLGYIELYNPVLLRAEVLQKREHHGEWTSLSMEITLHQNGSKLGVIVCNGSKIGAGVFEKIRKLKRSELFTLPFYPIEGLNYQLLLKSPQETVWIEAHIKQLNLSEFVLELPGCPNLGDSPFDFVFVVLNLGITKGSCTALEINADSCRFTIDTLPKNEEEQLTLFLKRCCKVPEEIIM